MAKHAAETADAIVRTALTLFGGDGTGEGFYRGEPYEIPGDDQLRLTGTEMGYGNRLPTQGAFSTDTASGQSMISAGVSIISVYL